MEMAGASKIHILVFPYPVQGHINPMLQFAKRLASKGLKVTLVTTTSNTKYSMQLAEATSCSLNINIESIYGGIDEGEKIESIEAYLERFKVAVTQSLAEFIQNYKHKEENKNKKVVLVYDSFIPWALDIARHLGVYGASFFTQSCAVCAIYYHVSQGALNINHLQPQQGIAAAAGSMALSVPSIPVLLGINDLPSFISHMDSYPALFTLALDQFSTFHKADWLFFNTFDKLEHEVVKWMASQWPIKTVGPTIPSMYLDKQRLEDDKDYGLSLFESSAEACLEWVESKESGSVVYVSFGSLANLADLQMEELAWGLMMSNCYFLWVVRASEQSKLPTDFMKTNSSKGLVVNWCPQLQILAHQAVGCFITHCGWNSTLEALSLGVPMVAMPQWTDQTTNAKFIVDVWHAGVRARVDNEKGLVSRDEIELCVRQVMEGETGNELRNNALRWKQMAQRAVHEGGSSDNNIEEFVSQLVNT